MPNVKTLFKAINPFFGHLSNWLDVFRKDGGISETGEVQGESIWDKISTGVSNWWKYSTHSGITDQQKEENALMRENRIAEYGDLVEGMNRAGLNPGLMYGGSPSSSGNAAPSASSGSLSDLLTLAMLPAQIANMNAQTSNIQAQVGLTKAQTGLTEQRTRTEEQITRLQSIAVEWQPTINAEQVAQMSANIDKVQSDISVNVAQENYITSQSIAQEITNSYLPKKYTAEVGSLDASAAASRATAAFTRVQYEFARDNKFLMSSNDTLLLGTYIASLFHVDKSDVVEVVEKGVKYAKEELPKDLKPWSKVDSDEAMNWFIEHAKHGTKD